MTPTTREGRRNYPRYKRGASENLRGPNRALSLDEQLEIQRAMREATANSGRWRTAHELAVRYGVSARTVWRYVATVPTPPGLERLRLRLADWADDRGIDLTLDDMVSLLYVIARHRDARDREGAA